MADRIRWPRFEDDTAVAFVERADDTILAELLEDAEPGHLLAIGLETGRAISAGKQIRLLDASGNQVAEVTTGGNDHGPYWIEVPADFVGTVELANATRLYVANPGVRLEDARVPRRHRILFTWVRDEPG